ncbi:hypothetical protein BDP27DRAFT_1189413, partial [Rhodocollybia butyracea]
PWQHMADTYAWVVEQEFVQVDRKNRTTEQWIFEQKVRFPDTQERRDIEERVRRRMWEEAVNNFDVEAEKWMRHEEELRRMAVERERQKAKALQEELRRYEARIRERRRGEEEIRYRAQHAAAIREREHQERVKGIVEGWERYEKQWASLTASSEPLGFTDIPWPLRTAPKTPEDITPTGVSAFLLSPLHSQNLSRKERIRAAQLRFHPDRALPRLMRRVKEEDKELVSDAVGIVARYLNDMMAREKRVS